MHENTTTVGVRTNSHERLDELADIEDESMTVLVSQIIDDYYEVVVDDEMTESERNKVRQNGGSDSDIANSANFEL